MFIPMVAVAQVVFALEMLRSSVLPVTPLALFAAGGVTALVEIAAAGIVTAAGGDAGQVTYLLAVPLSLTAVGFAWLGWRLWCEPAADHGRHLPRLAAG